MPRRLKVLHVLHAFSAGGLENGIVNLINGSPDHLEHEVCLMSRAGEFAARLTRPVVWHELNRRSGNDVGLLLRLRNVFRERRIDIVHTRNWAAFDGVLAACVTPGIRLVHGEHGRDMSDPGGEVRHRNLARRFLSFRAKKFVAVSKDLYQWLDKTVRIPNRKLEFIPNGVDTHRFHPRRDRELRESLGIAENEFVVGTIGRLDPIKNHTGLVNAISRLSPGLKAKLVIVGDGPHRTQVESAFRTANLNPEPILTGYRPDVERFYGVFDVFVLNSFAEGMSNTLLEAMASGLPIIGTRVGGNRELIKHGESGTLVDSGDDAALADAIRRYGEDRAMREAHGGAARREAVQEFSLVRMIQRYVSLYESISS